MPKLQRARMSSGGAAVALMTAAAIGGCSSSSSSSPASTSSSPAASAPSSSAPASTSSSPAASGSIRIAIFYYNPSPYGIASLNGAKEEAAKLGVQLDAFDANNNPTLQSTQIQDAITTGKYKAFWVWGLNDPA